MVNTDCVGANQCADTLTIISAISSFVGISGVMVDEFFFVFSYPAIKFVSQTVDSSIHICI